MSRSCTELEAKFGQSDRKCTHYREQFADCICERKDPPIQWLNGFLKFILACVKDVRCLQSEDKQ